MRRAPIAIALVLVAAALIAWRGRTSGSPFEFLGLRAGVDLKTVTETFPSGERVAMSCNKDGDAVECGMQWAQVGGWFYALVNQDRQVRAAIAIPGRGSPELQAEVARVTGLWKSYPHKTVPVPVDHVGDTIATRWTSKDGRWSATITQGGAAEGMPGYVLLLDEKHLRPQDRDRIRLQILGTVARAAWRPKHAQKEANSVLFMELEARAAQR